MPTQKGTYTLCSRVIVHSRTGEGPERAALLQGTVGRIGRSGRAGSGAL